MYIVLALQLYTSPSTHHSVPGSSIGYFFLKIFLGFYVAFCRSFFVSFTKESPDSRVLLWGVGWGLPRSVFVHEQSWEKNWSLWNQSKSMRHKAVLQKLENSYHFFLYFKKTCILPSTKMHWKLSPKTVHLKYSEMIMFMIWWKSWGPEWKLNITIYYTRILSKVKDLLQSASPQPYCTLYCSPTIGIAIHRIIES